MRRELQDSSQSLQGSALHRTKRKGSGRTAAIVLVIRRGEASLEVLEEALQDHDEPWVREHVGWALAQFLLHPLQNHADRARQALRLAFEREIDETVRQELDWVRTTHGL